MKMNAFEVFIGGEWVNTVFDQETDPNEVKRSLVNHDGYASSIAVEPARKNTTYQGRPWTEEQIRNGSR